jgi:sorbitol/mannitol transport system substrate-binding protein
MEALPDSYDLDDVLKPVRDALSYQGRLYALPLYAESSMTFYRTDLFEKAGIAMPEQPDYEQIARFAAARVTVPMTRCDVLLR